MRTGSKRFSTQGGVMWVTIGILFLCGMAFAAEPKPKDELVGPNGTMRIMEYINPFAMTITTYSVRNSVSNSSAALPRVQPVVLNNGGNANRVSPPGAPVTTTTLLRPLIRVPNAAPSRSPCKPV